MRSHIQLFLALTVAVTSANSQWYSYRDPKTPRMADGKPNLSAPAPRSAGKPDLSGVWQTPPTPIQELTAMVPNIATFDVPGDGSGIFSKYFLNLLADFKPGQAPLRPEAVRVMGELSRVPSTESRCLPTGMPRSDLVPAPLKIVQTPGLTLIADEAGSPVRQIYSDGRKHMPDPPPSWMGFSVGAWEGDTFVVNTIGFNDKTALDAFRHPHSESMKVEERFHRRDFGHMDVALTIDDPVMYTRPFTVKFTWDLLPDSDILESVCAENEKDLAHMKTN